MPARLPAIPLLLWLLVATPLAAQQTPSPSVGARRAALDSVAHNPRRMFQTVAARLATGTDTALAWRQLDSLLDAPTGDMFWTYPATCFWVCCRDRLNPERRARFRHLLQSYTPYRGDTENHFLMHYTYLLIFSEEWPEMRESEWFNGRSSAENHAEAREYLLHWIDETARQGLTEWDSPRYLYFYVGPLLALADGSRDTAVSRRASMLLELLLADYAVEYLNGAYCGAHSRDGDGSVIDPRRSEATAMGRLYFEDRADPPLPDLAFCALSRFTCPAVVRGIATDRSKPYLVTEHRRTRARMRGGAERYGRIVKQTWMTSALALGSMSSEGIAQPIQQHTWGVTFGTDRPNATIFSLHPDASEEELATYFPEEPELMEAGILGSKASYGNENRWIGGSRYEQVVQSGNCLLARYSIPPEARWGHVDLFIPKSLDTLLRDSSGWVFCRMGRGMVALYLFDTAVVWTDEPANWRVRLGSRETGVMVVCQRGGVDNARDAEAFIADCKAQNTLAPTLASLNALPFRVLVHEGDPLSITTTTQSSDLLTVDARTARATMKHSGRVRTLDFANATITESRE